ncbi:MAG: XRE family transcriptional regulator [Paludibacterium sp.]|uniref:helix-turn-helix domain-containing protein n=1 Tax=Paludibacterium sp. TaxID=1917523 RepID=UPI0025E57D9C|nr:helix-turn-helix transcriptional regulator [Paludibacterium sp.]MBV8046497.1 XRE family transcriptional regulator [Paludibacterium sp.]MBV8646549.1 XRE family transcriptional regulator [Paludibacterium sp.]
MTKHHHVEKEAYLSDDDEIGANGDEGQHAHIQARAGLMSLISTHIKQSRLTQTEVAQRCHLSQPRISRLMRQHVSQFSLDALVNIATALGLRVDFKLALINFERASGQWPASKQVAPFPLNTKPHAKGAGGVPPV